MLEVADQYRSGKAHFACWMGLGNLVAGNLTSTDPLKRVMQTIKR